VYDRDGDMQRIDGGLSGQRYLSYQRLRQRSDFFRQLQHWQSAEDRKPAHRRIWITAARFSQDNGQDEQIEL
jgi:hypothetical protein